MPFVNRSTCSRGGRLACPSSSGSSARYGQRLVCHVSPMTPNSREHFICQHGLELLCHLIAGFEPQPVHHVFREETVFPHLWGKTKELRYSFTLAHLTASLPLLATVVNPNPFATSGECTYRTSPSGWSQRIAWTIRRCSTPTPDTLPLQ